MSTSTTYRLLYTRAYNGTPDEPRPLYYRRRSPDPRHGYARWYVVEQDHPSLSPTEWRTREGVERFIAATPYLAETFEIVEITA